MDHGHAAEHGALSGLPGHSGGHVGHHEGVHGTRGGRVTRDTVLFSHAFGNAHQSAHFTRSGMTHFATSAHMDVSDAAVDRQGSGGPTVIGEVIPAGNCHGDTPTSSFMVHVVHHGLVDIGSVIAEMIKYTPVIRLDKRVPNMDSFHDEKPQIMSWYAWVPGMKPEDMPDGYVKGFTGKTTMDKQIFGVGVCLKGQEGLNFDTAARCFIEVSWVTWYYDQPTTFETKVTLMVRPLGYNYIVDKFNAHQKATLKLAQGIFKALSDAKPDKMQRMMMRYCELHGMPMDPARHPDGIYQGSPEDESEILNSDLQGDINDDMRSKDEALNQIDGTNVPSQESADPDWPDDAVAPAPGASLPTPPASGANLDAVLPDVSQGIVGAVPADVDSAGSTVGTFAVRLPK